MNLDELLQLQVLKLKAMSRGGALLEHAIDSPPEGVVIRQLCAKISADLYSDVENVCSILDLTKRAFVEAAVIEAVSKAHDLIEKSGGLEGLGFSPKE
jgi:hypothetical protein